MSNEEKQKNEDSKREANTVEEAREQAGAAPMREVIIWEKAPATQDGGRSQGESTVRAIPLGEGANTKRPPVIVIVSSGFGSVSRSDAAIRMNGARRGSGLRMAA